MREDLSLKTVPAGGFFLIYIGFSVFREADF